MILFTDLVFGIFQVEHYGSVFIHVLAVRVAEDVKHLHFNACDQLANVALGHIQLSTAGHPEDENKVCLPFKDQNTER